MAKLFYCRQRERARRIVIFGRNPYVGLRRSGCDDRRHAQKLLKISTSPSRTRMESILFDGSAVGMFSSASDLAIDLGSANTCIYTRGAVALNEPSVVAFNTARGGIEAIGTEAREMFGRTPANIDAVWPVRNGMVSDIETVEKMLAHFVRKAHGRSYARPRVVMGVSAASTPVQRRALKESASRMRVSDVCLVDEPMAAAIGAGMPVTEPTGNMIIDIGGGTTDIAVVSLSGVVYSRSLPVAGGDLDTAIIQHLKRRHSLLIGQPTAERIKCEIGSAIPLEKPLRMQVKGRHLTEGVPRTVTITDAEVREALSEPLRAMLKAVREALECVPPELSGDIYERGVVLTGGVSLLRKIDDYLRKATGLPVIKAEDPLATVVIGAGRLLTNRELLTKLTVS
jgi:rod shape-determining protein MreB and related proteins